MNITGLKMEDPEFHLDNEDTLWLSRMNYKKHVNETVALIKDKKVYGLARFRKPIEVTDLDLDDILERVPNKVYKYFKDISYDELYAYPVVAEEKFYEPLPVKDGLKEGHRNWVKEVNFVQIDDEDIEKYDNSKLQSIHDRLHSISSCREPTYHEYCIHYKVANEYNNRNMTHPDFEDKFDNSVEFDDKYKLDPEGLIEFCDIEFRNKDEEKLFVEEANRLFDSFIRQMRPMKAFELSVSNSIDKLIKERSK